MYKVASAEDGGSLVGAVEPEADTEYASTDATYLCSTQGIVTR